MTDKKTHQGLLVISRHTESEWNLLGKWTGMTDVSLTEKGLSEAAMLGEALVDIDFDGAYTSDLQRTQQTLAGIIRGKQAAITLDDDSIKQHSALNERDYGKLTGKNKWEVKDEIGEEAFNGIRRGWDYPVPGGETLKAVHGRVVPFFEEEILPRVRAGENILLVAHGNSIRALMKHLEEIDEKDIAEVEMPFGTILIYHFAPGKNLPVSKELRAIDTVPPHA